MTGEAGQEHISKRVVAYEIPGMETVSVRSETYGNDGEVALTMDLYRPSDPNEGAPLPVVIIVAGYPDPGVERALGCKFKDLGSSVSWGRLMAASGVAAITYTNRDPTRDARQILRYVRRNAASLGLDAVRVGLWASSGHVPLALSLLMEAPDALECAVLCYGYTLDLDGATGVADAAREWGFVNPCSGKSVEDLPKDVPLFVARAGRDSFPRLNEALDRFLAEALRSNLPVTIVNYPEAPHAFDLFVDGEATREIVREILAFVRFHLGKSR
jgi:acetyl esterase/lipase